MLVVFLRNSFGGSCRGREAPAAKIKMKIRSLTETCLSQKLVAQRTPNLLAVFEGPSLASSQLRYCFRLEKLIWIFLIFEELGETIKICNGWRIMPVKTLDIKEVSTGRPCRRNQFLDRTSNPIFGSSTKASFLSEGSKWHLAFLEQGLPELPKLARW